MTAWPPPPPSEPYGEIVLYQTDDEITGIEVRLQEETVWLPQWAMAELFQVSLPTINEHLANLYDEGEVPPQATIRKFRIVQREGRRQIARDVEHANVDVIISVGYRVRPIAGRSSEFCAMQRLREYVITGFAMDDERLKRDGGLPAARWLGGSHWLLHG